jgi:hypothetical protein
MVETAPVFRLVGEPRPVLESDRVWSFEPLGRPGELIVAEPTESSGEYFELIQNWSAGWR